MVTFYEINSDGQPGKPVLYLDTLKVSTIEQTAETAEVRGGKGNPVLVSWDYGKEINVTIEDALFSSKSMAIMFGDGTVNIGTEAEAINRLVTVRATTTALPDYFIADVYDAQQGSARKKVYTGTETSAPSGMIKFADSGITLVGVFNEKGTEIKDSSDASITDLTKWQGAAGVVAGNKYMIKYTVNGMKKTITISGDSFPGTYYVTGDTYARSDVDGKDQFFQFIIPKAKMQSENTITLEAEGDPSVFNMSLKALRPEDGDMMKLVQYDLVAPPSVDDDD